MAPAIMPADYYEAPLRHTGVFEPGLSLFWSLTMVPKELQRQVR